MLELLNLKFYRELGKLAAKKKGDFLKDRKRLEIELEDLPNPYAEDLKIQEELIGEENDLLERLEKKHEGKETELRNAGNAEEWQGKIDEIKNEQEKNTELVKQSAQIEANAKRFRQLDGVLLPLENFWQAQETIEKKNSELAQFTEVLQRRENIERDFKRHEILRENLPKLHQLKKDTEDLTEAEKKRDETEISLEDLNSKIEESRKEVGKLKSAFEKKKVRNNQLKKI